MEELWTAVLCVCMCVFSICKVTSALLTIYLYIYLFFALHLTQHFKGFFFPVKYLPIPLLHPSAGSSAMSVFNSGVGGGGGNKRKVGAWGGRRYFSPCRAEIV